jgi:hypothetical protein
VANKKSKQIDLVIYKSGERIVVGRAIVNGDGSITAQIAKDVRKEYKDLIYGDMLDHLSLNPKAPAVLDLKYTSVHVDTKTQVVDEVAYVPPLKIKE